MKISLIVAMAENRVIGKDNQLPWHLSADLKRFKKITMGHPIVMGRKTYESIGKPLPGRKNIVLSRNPNLADERVEWASSKETALAAAAESDETFVIGGSAIYDLFFSDVSQLYITEIHKKFEGDAFFPEISMNEWEEVARETVTDDEQVDFDYSFVKYSRKF